MLLYYHGQLSWVTRSCGLPYGIHSMSCATVLESIVAAISDASSGHLRRCNDADTHKQCLSRVKDASILSWPTIMGH
eukprot:scaffold6416_cov111-Skeletonema_marinoi.AAC.8